MSSDYGNAFGALALFTTVLPLIIGFIALAVNVILGIVCMNLAGKRGFNKAAGFFAGFLGGLVSLCIILLFPAPQSAPMGGYQQGGQY